MLTTLMNLITLTHRKVVVIVMAMRKLIHERSSRPPSVVTATAATVQSSVHTSRMLLVSVAQNLKSVRGAGEVAALSPAGRSCS